jgi:hypothetical protein
MQFKEFKALFQKNFERMTKDTTHLFEVEVDKDVMWNLYLDSFPAGTNEVFRQRREHDCSCCRHFIKTIGNAVVIKGSKVETIWDFKTGDSTFQPVTDALSKYIKSKLVEDVFVSKFKKVGTDKNFEQGDGEITEWQHFYLELPDKLVDKTGKSESDIKGGFRDIRNVFKRSLDEITEESIVTVHELIAQNSLYKGEEWKPALTEFLRLKRQYDALKTSAEKENYAWEQSVVVGGAIGKIKNHSIGVLLTNISEGMELDEAVKRYEAIVAPSNYKRPKAIFTKKMLEDAKKTIEELGYLDSLGRRHATLDDITVNNILFSNKDATSRIKGSDVFLEMSGEVALDPKKFSKVEEVTIENFVSKVLPTITDLELFLENKHAPNMVSLIAPVNKDAKSMLKWNNAFSWAYSGNIADSDIKQRVKDAGGNVEGVLRFSIQWNDGDEYDGNDLDAHCREPNGNHIYYPSSARRSPYSNGWLDVDIIHPIENKPAVENIAWADSERMLQGKYEFFVNCYSARGGKGGFRAEIEFGGQVYSFDYSSSMRTGESVAVATVTFNASAGFTIKESLPSNISTRDVWNLKTNQFIPVSVAMYSPNYWDGQSGIGHRHYFFMLKDCVNPECPNGFYNEFLDEELMKHKHVLEALGGKLSVINADDQLSGLGFSSTKRNEVLARVTGQSKRIIKIKF